MDALQVPVILLEPSESNQYLISMISSQALGRDDLLHQTVSGKDFLIWITENGEEDVKFKARFIKKFKAAIRETIATGKEQVFQFGFKSSSGNSLMARWCHHLQYPILDAGGRVIQIALLPAGYANPLSGFGKPAELTPQVDPEQKDIPKKQTVSDYTFGYQPLSTAGQSEDPGKAIQDKLFSAMVKHSADGIVILDGKGRAINVSPSVERILGYTVEEAQQFNFDDLIHPDDRPMAMEKLKEVMANPGIPVEGHVIRTKHKDGSWRWIAATLTNLLHDPEVKGVVDNFRDVTELVISNQKLNTAIFDLGERMKELTCLFKVTQLAVSVHDIEQLLKLAAKIIPPGWQYPEHTHVLINFDKKQYKSRGFRESSHHLEFSHDFEDGLSLTIRVYHEDHSVADARAAFLDSEKVLLNNLGSQLVLSINNMRAAQQLQRSEKRLQTIIDSEPECIKVVSRKGILLDMNPAGLTMLNAENRRDKVVGKKVSELIHPGDWHVFQAMHKQALRGKTSENRFRIISFDGSIKYTESVSVPLRDHQGNIESVLSVTRDITARHKAEDALQRAIHHRDLLLQSTAEGIYGIDVEGRCTFINKAALEMLGFSEEECIGVNMHSLIHHTHSDGKDFPETECPIYLTTLTREGCRVNDEIFWKKDGSPLEVRYMSNPVLDADKVIGSVVSFIDIAEQKRAKEEILESRDRFQSLVQSIDGIVWEADARTFEFTYISPQVKDVLGYTPEEWLSQNNFWYDHIVESDRNHALNHCKSQVEKLADYTMEYRFLAKDGSEVWIEDIVSVIARDNKPHWLRGIMVDITARKNLEQETLRTKEYLERIMDQSTDIICTADSSGNFITVSRAAEKIWGYAPEELEGSSFLKLLHPDDLEKTRAIAAEVKGGQVISNFENRYIRKDNKVVDMVWSARWSEADQMLYCIARDATAKKKAELHMQQLINNTEEAFVLLNKKLEIISFNQSFLRQYKQYLGKEVKLGDSIMDYVSPSRVQTTSAIYDRVLQGSKEESELIIPLPDNDQIIFHLRYKPAQNSKGSIIGVFVSIVDITEKKLALDQIRESEAKYRTLFNVNPLPCLIYALDDLKILDVNQTAIDHYGYSRQEFLQKSIYNIRPKGKIKGMKEGFKKIFESKGTVDLGINTHIRKDGSFILMDMRGHRFNYQGRDCVLVIGHDVTEKEKLLNELSASNQRFEYITEATFDAIYDFDLRSLDMYWGSGFQSMFGHPVGNAQSNYAQWYNNVHHDDIDRVLGTIEKTLTGGKVNWQEEYRFRRANGEYAHVIDRAKVLRNNKDEPYRIVGAMQDVTESRYLHKLEALERLILQMHADAGNDLKKIFMALLTGLEEIHPGQKLSLQEVKHNQLFDLASPSLSPGYLQAISGISIGPAVGSSGTAAFTGQEVLVDNVFKDAKWKDFHHLAMEYGFKACHSFPVIDGSGDIKAVLATYHKSATPLSAIELSSVSWAVNVIRIILENHYQRQAIEESNERYHYVNLATRDAIFDWNIDGNRIYWGRSFKRMFGYEDHNETFTIEEWLSMIHPKDRDRVREELNFFIHQTEEINGSHEYRVRCKDGSYLPIEGVGYLIKNEKGKVYRMIGVLRDLTRAKREEVHKKLLVDSAAMFNSDGSLHDVLREVLERLTQTFRYDLGEVWLVNQESDRILPLTIWPDDANFKKFFASKKTADGLEKGIGLPGEIWECGEFRYWTGVQDNEHFLRKKEAGKLGIHTMMGIPLISQSKVIGAVILGVKHEITKDLIIPDLIENFGARLGTEITRKQIEEELNEIFDNAPDVICLLDRYGVLRKVNPAFYDLTGYVEGELIGTPLENLLHPDDRKKVMQKLLGAGKEKGQYAEARIVSKLGVIRWLALSSTFSRDQNRVLAMAKDLTVTKHFEKLLDRATDLATIGGWEADLATGTIFWSKITQQIYETPLDYTPDFESALIFMKDDADRDKMVQLGMRAIEEGKPWDEEFLIITMKGNEKWIRSIGEPEYLNGQCIRLIGSIQDITERRKGELLLVKKTKLLSAITLVNTSLLQRENWVDTITDTFEVVGKAVEVDRVYYFKFDYTGNDKPKTVSQQFEWAANGVQAQIENPELQSLPVELVGEFIEPLYEQKIFKAIVSRMSKGFTREILESQDILSILILPIIIDDQLWGFIGFDDCKNERQWTEDEIDFLRTITHNFNSAIISQQAEDAIKAALDEKHTILESIGDGFFTLEKDWTVTYWNSMAESLLKEPSSKILYRNLWNVFPKDMAMESFEAYSSVMESGEPKHFETFYPVLDSWFEVSAYPSAKGISVYFKDITLKKRAQEEVLASNQRFQKVAEATHDAIWDWDINNNTLYWGHGFSTLFGYDVETFEPSIDAWAACIHPEDIGKVLSSLHMAIDDPGADSWKCEYRFLNSKQHYAYVVDRGAIIRDNNNVATRMVGAVQDITGRMEHEKSLLRLNEQLEKSNKELAKSNAELEQFAYIASHDLQEPLRMITSFLAQLEKKYIDILDEKGKKYIHFAVDGARRMRQIILDLLDYSRVGRTEDKLEKLDVRAMIDDILVLFQKQISEKGAEVEIGEMPVIHSFKSPIRLVLQNLIDNGLKYHTEGAIPRLSIQYRDLDTHWQFSVQDNGIGIDPSYFEKVFIIFQRLHQRDEFTGTGLGLAISKKIVENLGGKIWLESQPGKGTTFHFTLRKQNEK